MAVTAYTFPGTAAQAVQGGSAWTNVNNVKANDSNYATDGFLGGAYNFEYRHVRLLKAGVISGSDIGANEDTFTNPRTLGSSTNLFSTTITPADVNDSGFGIAIAWGQNVIGVHSDKTDYIQVTNFGFAIPPTASVDGIEILCAADMYPGGGGTSGLEVNYIQVRVYYTYINILQAQGQASGLLWVPNTNRTAQQKRYRHLISDKNDAFIGEFGDEVASETTFQQDINNLHTSLDVTLEQNEISNAVATDTLVTETPDTITTEGDEDLLADIATPTGIGPGTNAEVTNHLEVVSYYGEFVELITESGEPITTEDDQLITVPDGAPDGRTIWTGWMSDFELHFGNADNLVTKWLSHSQELNNIMLETNDTVNSVSSSADGSSLPIVGSSGGPTDPYGAAQTFTAGSTFKCSRITLDKVRNDFVSNSTARISVYVGGNPNALGALVATADTTLIYDPDNYPTIQSLNFVFSNPPTFTNAQAYTIIIESVGTSKTGGGALWPLNVYTATGFTGDVYEVTNSSPGVYVSLSPRDILFTIYTAGGNTTVPFNSYDPSQILRDALTFAATRGARVSWTADSIPLSGTLVSYTFRGNTIDEVFSKVLELLPADWYGFYDPGTNQITCKPRPDNITHTFTRNKDIVSLTITRSLRKQVNDVYFSGGGSPALFVRVTDNTSVNTWRRAIEKKSDNRVTDTTTARILAQSEVDRLKDPIDGGMLTAVPQDFAVEDVELGELIGFQNAGLYVDALALQIVSRTYHPDTVDLTLSILLPAVSKRIEDIKRNLNVIEQQNDPSAPS